MVKFIEVDPRKIDNVRQGRRGRVSYPILKGFLEKDVPLVQLDRTGMQQSLQALYSSLRAYVLNHEMPVHIFSRQGELYLARTDMDEDGNPLTDTEEQEAVVPEDKATPITPEEVERRFAEEEGQTTK